MTERKRALIISPEFPYPLTSGGTQRTFHVLSALALDYQVDLLTFAEEPQPEGLHALEQICARVHVILLPHHSKEVAAFVWRNVRRAVQGINPLIDRFSEPFILDRVRSWLSANTYDLILLEHSWIAHYIDEIKTSSNRTALTVLDAHNVESNLWRQYYERPDTWYHKPALYRYWRSVHEYEQRYRNLASSTFF